MSTLRARLVALPCLAALALFGCSAAPEGEEADVLVDDASELTTLPIALGKVFTATLGCTPRCTGAAWLDGCTGKVITYAACSGQAAYCDKVGTLSEGWYATTGALLTKATCSGLATTNLTGRASFVGKAGQKVDIFVDGLLQRTTPALTGLDTTVKVTRARSASWSVSNDNTATPGFVVRNNPAPNAKSSSLNGLVLPADDTYTITVSAMGKRQGSIELVVKAAN
jgi:hypothetical protein